MDRAASSGHTPYSEVANCSSVAFDTTDDGLMGSGSVCTRGECSIKVNSGSLSTGMSVALTVSGKNPMSTLTLDRRDETARARIVQRVVSMLRENEGCTLELLARAAGYVPHIVVARIVKRLALRGLARTISEGYWCATAALRVVPALVECPVA
jgi:hypothetical protein